MVSDDGPTVIEFKAKQQEMVKDGPEVVNADESPKACLLMRKPSWMK